MKDEWHRRLRRSWALWERTMASHATPFDPSAEAQARANHFDNIAAHENHLRMSDLKTGGA